MTGKELVKNLKYYDSYAKYIDSKGRKETWEEAAEDVMSMHKNKFKTHKNYKELLPHILAAEEAYKETYILASQRNLQYREKQILQHNHRLFNCASTYIDRPEVFKQIMYVLLGGCGMGYSVENRFIDKLPKIKERKDKTITHVIEDSIEGWANALDALMMSFFKGSEQIRFDGSNVRDEGALISGGFKAPGYEPLRKALELIEGLLQSKIKEGDFKLTSLDSHEVICIASDAVLAAGVRRSALICLFDKDDLLMLKCKTGDWFPKKPWLARANNSVKLLKGSFTKEEFDDYKQYIKEFGEPGIVLVTDMRFCTNPCVEIGFIPVNPKTGKSCISFCNLNEINGGLCKTEEEFYAACKNAAILGTLQASYTDMPFLGQDTMDLIEWEALIGVSITGFMNNPSIFLNPDILRRGAEIVVETNLMIAILIDINPAARTTCVKPSGNASVLLMTSSGIHAAHAKIYFRLIQMNKESEMAKVLEETNPVLLEESVWSESKSDYVVYVPTEEPEEAITKDDINDIQFLEYVKLVYENWVMPGNVTERGYSAFVTHNVSNTVDVQNWDRVFDFIFDNQESFCGLSFMAELGDKVYKQAPFTKIMPLTELIEVFGEGALFASGLIVDALHIFNNDLWDACEAASNKGFPLTGDRYSLLLKKDIVKRMKKFAKNYFKGSLPKMVDCIKNVHIFHKYKTIQQQYKPIDFSKIEMKPSYTNVNEMGGVSCSGGVCEIIQL